MKNEEKVTIMSFYENWVELMQMCTPEEWYELCTIMTNLRFRGEDTNTKEIENIKVKMAWNLIRPSILKSNRDSRYNKNKRNNNTSSIETENKPVLTPQNNEDDNLYQPIEESGLNSLKMPANTEFDIPTVEVKEPEIEEEFDDFSEELYNLLESEDMDIIRNILERAIDYNYFNKPQYEYFYTNGQNKIKDIYSQYIKSDKDIKDFENYCGEYNKIYHDSIINKNNNINYEKRNVAV